MEASEIFWLYINPFEAVKGVRDFLEIGGRVLSVILFANLFLWFIFYERVFFFRVGFKTLEQKILDYWRSRSDHESWFAHRIREQLISVATLRVRRNISMIKILVALAPLLGLVGTVTGMVEVFDVLAITGSGNARAMASGISKATIPTMAGLVTAVSGIAFVTLLDRNSMKAIKDLEEKMIVK